MPKYLVKVRYSPEGTRGVAKNGGSPRVAAAKETIESVGGKLEAFYFAFGEDDAYVIVDGPDNIAAAAASLAVNSSGVISTTTVVLLTPEEIDQAAKRQVTFRPPSA